MDPISSSFGLYQGVQIVKDVGTQSYRLFVARSGADWHFQQLLRAESDAAYWNNHVQNLLQNAREIPGARLETIKTNSAELNAELERYRKRVRRWCERLSICTDVGSDEWTMTSASRDDKSSTFSSRGEGRIARVNEVNKRRIRNQGRVRS